MKKLGSIIVLLIVIAGIWVYMANKFEKIANNDLLPKIQNNDPIIKVDLDSIIIEKFKFRLTLKDVTILPNTPDLRIKIDKIITSYNPFTDKITICLNSDKLLIGTDNTAIYIPSPNQTITFNRSILTNNFNDIDLTTTLKKPVLYFANDEFIGRAANYKLTLSSELKDENYFINLKISSDKTEINPDSKYIAYLLNNLISNPLIKDTYLGNKIDNDNYQFKIMEITGPTDRTSEYSVKLSENALNDIAAALQGTKKSSEVLNNFDFKKENYSFSMKGNLSNNSIKNTGFVHFSGDGFNINANMDISNITNYSDIQKQKITSITSDVASKFMQQITKNEKLKFNQSFKGTADDFMPLAKSITDIKNTKIALNVDYNIESGDFTHALNIDLNGFNMKLNGALKEKIYNADTSIKTPSLLINSLTDFYQISIKPLLIKNTTIENASDIDFFHAIVKNIKNNGVEALSALHSGEELQEDDILTADFVFNTQNFDFKINDKEFFDILSDQRVVKFLQGMPKKDNQEN